MQHFMTSLLPDVVAFAVLGLMAGAVGIFVMPGCSVRGPTGRGRQIERVGPTLISAVAGALLAGLFALYMWPPTSGQTHTLGLGAAFFGALIALWIYAIWTRFLSASR